MTQLNDIRITRINAALIILLFYINQVFGSHDTRFFIFESPIILIVTAWVAYLFFVKDHGFIYKTLSSLYTIWIIAVSTMIFVYGFIIKSDNFTYARSFQIMQLLHIILIICLLMYEKDNLWDILPVFASVELIAMTITALVYDHHKIYENLFEGGGFYGEINRLGEFPNYGLIEVSMNIALMMIIVFGKVLYEKNKRYIIPILIGTVLLALNQSKTGILAVIIGWGIMIVWNASTKRQRAINVCIIIGCIAILAIACYLIPILNKTIFTRFVEVVQSFSTIGDVDLYSSSSRRLNYMITAIARTSEAPLLGHGFDAFQNQVTGFMVQQAGYSNSHTNYSELLYNHGIIGFTLYYWFPVVCLIKALRMDHSRNKLIIVAMTFAFFIFELGNVTFYRNTICYIGFALVYILIGQSQKAN